MRPNGHLLKAFYDHLPFTLTKGQTQAFLDIQADMESEVPMQRLVQGDVGSGKTVVAALALAKIVENGYQGASWRRRASWRLSTMKNSAASFRAWTSASPC